MDEIKRQTFGMIAMQMFKEWQAQQETLEILQDSELMEAIAQSEQALQNGETVSLEEARKNLGLL